MNRITGNSMNLQNESNSLISSKMYTQLQFEPRKKKQTPFFRRTIQSILLKEIIGIRPTMRIITKRRVYLKFNGL
jgi:hypothetical protein